MTRQETGYFAYYHVLSFQNGDVNKFPYRYLSCFNHRTHWGQIFSEISFLGILDFKICLLNHRKSRNITGQNISPIFKIKDKLKVYKISLLIMEVKWKFSCDFINGFTSGFSIYIRHRLYGLNFKECFCAWYSNMLELLAQCSVLSRFFSFFSNFPCHQKSHIVCDTYQLYHTSKFP